jgi:hypothetical protein
LAGFSLSGTGLASGRFFGVSSAAFYWLTGLGRFRLSGAALTGVASLGDWFGQIRQNGLRLGGFR